MKRNTSVFTLLILLSIMLSFTACKKDSKSSDNNSSSTKKYALIIQNGAQTIAPSGHITYSAVLVDANGNITTPTGISWSTSSTSIATINTAGTITTAGTGDVKITATVTVDGVSYSASVPLGVYIPTSFSVAPSAIVWTKGDDMQLESVFLSTSGVTHPTCSYTTSNSSIATVSSSGLVHLVETGECKITVTATSLNGNPTVEVPVMVVGLPEISLPIVKIQVTPPASDLFKNETMQLSAKAYKSDGSEATGTSFTWNSTNAAIATVSASGLVTPVKTGVTYIQAMASGIVGQAEITVNSDTLVVVSPFYTSIPAGGSKQFTAQAYHITRNSATLYNNINFDWQIPTYGIDIFDIATVNSTGLVALKSNAIAGMTTFVCAYDHANQYVGSVGTIMVSIADNCDCGNGNPLVDHISVSNGPTINMTVVSGQPVQLNATAYSAQNTPVSTPDLVYCSDNLTVASVDQNGLVIAAGAEGDATIRICSGSYASTTVTVHVTLMK